MLRREYQNQLQIISNLKKQLNDLELKETEEINQLELERSLLNAEFDSESQKISKVKLKIALLKHKETRLSGFYEELRKEFQVKINQAQSRIATLEEAIERVNHCDHEQVSKLREQLELERKSFEDMEFHQMEEAAHKETERDELLKEIRYIFGSQSKLLEFVHHPHYLFSFLQNFREINSFVSFDLTKYFSGRAPLLLQISTFNKNFVKTPSSF